MKTLATQKCIVVALSLALGVSSLRAGTTLKYVVAGDGVRSWNHTNSWYTTGGAQYGYLPGKGSSSDWVWLIGTDLSPATPLLVTNGVAAKPQAIVISRSASDNAALRVDSGGSFAISGSGGNNTTYGYIVGSNGRGMLVANGGSANIQCNSQCYIGLNAGSLGIISNLAGSVRHGSITLGNAANATGVVAVAGGLFYAAEWQNSGRGHAIKVGNKGVGVLDVTGGSYDGCSGVAAGSGGGKVDIYLGYGQGGCGKFLARGGTVEGAFVFAGYGSNSVGHVEVDGGKASAMRSFYIGVNGTGTMDVKSNFSEGELRIGGQGAGTGRVTVYAGVTNTIVKSSYDNGEVHVGGGGNASFGAGKLLLKGGAIWVKGSSTFNIGVGESPGLVRGWGVVLPQSLNTRWTQSLTLKFGNGVVVADGEGQDRLLDFNDPYQLVRCVTNSVSGGTNGWYAVNGGAVHFPYVDHAYNATVERCLGDNRWAAKPDLVNSVWLSIKGTGGGALHGGFYASDRTDCHLDTLPENDGIVGVWKLGATTSDSSTGCSNWHSWESGVPCTTMTKAAAKFHYDEAAIPAKAIRLLLYRYESGAWKQVAEKRLEGGDNPTIATDFLNRITDDKANIGTFALVARKQKGLRFFVR